MVLRALRPLSFLIGLGAMLLLALAGPASSEGYGDPAIVPEDGGVVEVVPGGEFTVSFTSNVECSWTSRFNRQTGPGSIGFDYASSFTAPTTAGTYQGTVVCRFSAAGPFRPVAYSEDADYAATRDQTTTQTFTVVVDGDAGTGDAGDESGDDATGANADTSKSGGALADTGGTDWELLALGAGLLVVGGGVAVAARRRKSA